MSVYSKGTKVFYSGAESDSLYSIVEEFSDNCLMSYHYLRNKGADALMKRKEAKPTMKFFIDSGAYTLQQEQGAHFTKGDWERYLSEYVAWLEKYKEYVYCAAELDVQSNTGNWIIPEWRKQYFEPLEERGMQIVYVWHMTFGLDHWEEMCKKYRYVGIGSTVIRDTAGVPVSQLMRTARRYRTRVHGFGLTSYKAIRDYNLASADSTTWIARGSKFGDWCIWNGSKISTIPDKSKREAYRGHIESLGFNFNAMADSVRPDWREACRFCLNEFRRMEDDLNARYADGKINYWDVRTPYPETLKHMSDESLALWGLFLELGGDASWQETLRAVSCVQNYRLKEYLRHKESHDEIMSACMGSDLVDVNDEEGLIRLADEFNGLFSCTELVQARNISENFDTALLKRELSVSEELSLGEFEDEELLELEKRHE